MQINRDNKLYYIVMAADMALIFVLNYVLYLLFMNLSPMTFPNIGFKLTTFILLVAHLISFTIRPSVNQKRFNTSEDVVKNVLITGMLFGVFTSLIIILFYPSMRFPRTYFFTFVIIFVLLLLIERLVLRKIFFH